MPKHARHSVWDCRGLALAARKIWQARVSRSGWRRNVAQRRPRPALFGWRPPPAGLRRVRLQPSSQPWRAAPALPERRQWSSPWEFDGTPRRAKWADTPIPGRRRLQRAICGFHQSDFVRWAMVFGNRQPWSDASPALESAREPARRQHQERASGQNSASIELQNPPSKPTPSTIVRNADKRIPAP